MTIQNGAQIMKWPWISEKSADFLIRLFLLGGSASVGANAAIGAKTESTIHSALLFLALNSAYAFYLLLRTAWRQHPTNIQVKPDSWRCVSKGLATHHEYYSEIRRLSHLKGPHPSVKIGELQLGYVIESEVLPNGVIRFRYPKNKFPGTTPPPEFTVTVTGQ